MSKFIVIRDVTLDPVVIESEGLTVGRLIGNDLALNHPTVSRTHAGIKEIEGDYWIFNLSEANGTLLNGEQIEKTPLADGDLIQIGPFFLYPKYDDKDLRLEVEMTVNPLPVEASSSSQIILPAEQRKTVLLDPRSMGRLNVQAQLQRDKVTPKGTRRLTGTGILTGRLTPLDEQALKIFWDKRKREAVNSPPTRRQAEGQAFGQGAVQLVSDARPAILLADRPLLVGRDRGDPARGRRDVPFQGRLFARPAFDVAFPQRPLDQPGDRENREQLHLHDLPCGSGPMNQNCASCHTTSAFSSDVSDIHMKVGMTCVSCHSEHNGRGFSPRLVANVACTGCHRDGSEFRSPLTGQLLKTPHGNVTGYPVTDGRCGAGISQKDWQRKELPGTPAQYNTKEQFHLIHTAGRQKGAPIAPIVIRPGLKAPP